MVELLKADGVPSCGYIALGYWLVGFKALGAEESEGISAASHNHGYASQTCGWV